MKRIEFLKKKWIDNDRMIVSAGRDFSLRNGDNFFDFLLHADPTPKYLYADFVFRCYANGEFLIEDIDRVRETLSHFHKNKSRLPVERRDIGGYASERDVWTALTQAGLLGGPEGGLSGKESKRSDRNRAHLESEVVTAEGWTMVKLGSAFSATWWGMGTRWCTTEKSGRTYQSYAARGPLRVFVSPDGIKHQLHVSTSSLCDAQDKRVNIGKYLRTLPAEFMPHIHADVTAYCEGLSLPDANSDHEFRYLYNALLQLPQEFFSEEISATVDRLRQIGLGKLAILDQRDGWVLKKTTGDFSSWALHAEEGIPYDGNRFTPLLLVESPDHRRFVVDFEVPSAELVLPVVPDMPPPLREKFLAWGVKNWHCHRDGGIALHNMIASVPPGEFSTAFWKAWAKRLGGHDVDCLRRDRPEDRFGSVPVEVVTEDIALVLAKQGLRDRIPDAMLTVAVARTLAKADAASRIDPQITVLFTPDDVADIYGGNSGRNLGGLPVEYRTYDMAKRIVKQRRAALRELLKMVRNGDFDLEGMPLDDAVEELSLGAITESAASLVDVDIPLPREVYLGIVRRDAGMLSWVPLPYRDVELCSASMTHSDHGLCHFPEWVVAEIRTASDGGHGITHNYRPSTKYVETLRALRKPEGEIAACLPPFSVQAFVAAGARH
ncbi:hypothetical protein GOB57_23940 [Sinorhizobium meliloti]|nr:hypothetical protein [Sinorhizobium meliloti]